MRKLRSNASQRIRTRAKMGPEYTELKGLVKNEGLHTVGEEAGCPNIYECWRTGRRRSSSAASSARAVAISARSTPASRPRSIVTSRAGSPRASRRWVCAIDHHRCGPRRPARRRRLAVRGDRASDPRDEPGHRCREPDPRFNGKPICWPRCRVASECSRTTWRPCHASSSGSARRSATSARSA